jgi:hypothetical protein
MAGHPSPGTGSRLNWSVLLACGVGGDVGALIGGPIGNLRGTGGSWSPSIGAGVGAVLGQVIAGSCSGGRVGRPAVWTLPDDPRRQR